MNLTVPNSVTILLAICSGAVVVQRLMRSRRRNNPLPPGPKPLPLIGNALDMPVKQQWETYLSWSKQYGSDIIYVNALGTPMLILNSYDAAEDLLDKRSGIYSSRPHIPMIELSGVGMNLTILPYGELWRNSRRLFTKHMNVSRKEVHQPREVKYVQQFLIKLADTPESYMKHIRHVVGANALSSMFGLEVLPSNDPYVDGAEVVTAAATPLLVPGAFLVDIFPILRHIPTWFPGAKFHQTAARVRAALPLVREVTFSASQELKHSGRYDPCLAINGLEELETLGLTSSVEDIEILKEVCETGFLAASDTTVSAISTFFLAMVLYPEIQKKAQAELDEALQGRLPTHEQIEKLPYLNALILEVFRWHPVLPMGVPHSLVGGDTYRGYHIPDGTIVFANQWAMLHDEQTYPEPFDFKPERFLNSDRELNPKIRSPLEIAFGFGRRICPGLQLAHSLLRFTAASVLSTFNLSKERDQNGMEIPVKEDFNIGSILQVVPFPCHIEPRSRETESLLDELRSV